MVSFNIDVKKTLEKINIINYKSAFIISELCTAKGVEIEVVLDSGSTIDVRIAAEDLVFFVDTQKILMRAVEAFSIEPSIDRFNAIVRAGEAHYGDKT